MMTLRKLMLAFASISLLFLPGSSYAILNIDDNANLNNTTYYLENEGVIPDCTTGSGGGGGGTALSGSDHVAAAFNFLVGKGLTPEQAAGAVGNMVLESGIGPQRLEGTSVDTITPYDSVPPELVPIKMDGWGIVQWTPHTKIGDGAKAAGKDPNDMGAQLDFLWHELTTNESAALAQLKAATSTEAATIAWGQAYERPLSLNDSIDLRLTYAIAVFQYMTTKTPLPPNIASLISTTPLTGSAGSAGAASCPSSSGTGGSGISGYKNPFRDWPGIVPYRIDSGVDYDGKPGPIYSIGNAKITALNRSNWYALNYLVYKFTDGPANGLEVYLSEECDFPSSLHVGDAITADTVLCNYIPTQDPVIGIEIGWSSLTTKGTYNVYWNNTVTGGGGTTDSNGGIDFNNFLVKLGAPSGINHNDGPGMNPPPPPDWPKW